MRNLCYGLCKGPGKSNRYSGYAYGNNYTYTYGNIHAYAKADIHTDSHMAYPYGEAHIDSYTQPYAHAYSGSG